MPLMHNASSASCFREGTEGKMGEAVLLPVSEIICEQFMKAWAVQKQGLLRLAEVEVALQSYCMSLHWTSEPLPKY